VVDPAARIVGDPDYHGPEQRLDISHLEEGGTWRRGETPEQTLGARFATRRGFALLVGAGALIRKRVGGLPRGRGCPLRDEIHYAAEPVGDDAAGFVIRGLAVYVPLGERGVLVG
jgi:hypothetical protein